MENLFKSVMTVLIATIIGSSLIFLISGCLGPGESARQTFFLKEIAVSEQRQAMALERIADRVCPEQKSREVGQ